MNNKLNILWVLLFLIVPIKAHGQADTIISCDPFCSLSTIIGNDTAGAGNYGWLQHTRVYVLPRDHIFLWGAVCTLQNNRKLKIRAGSGSGLKPQIWMTDVGTTDRPVGTMVLLKSDDTLDIKDVDISGYNEDFQEEVHGVQGQLFNIMATNTNSSMFIENCILKSTSGNHIRADGAPKTIRVTNCIFGDMGNCATSNLGAGKAIDIRANVVDTLDMQNNTFVNFQNRIIRHYQSGANKIVNLKFNHNTCVNGMSYHGWLSLGSVGSAQINNNLLIDHFALGADTAAIRQAEFSDAGENDALNGLPRITWITAVPPGPTDTYEIKRNFYGVSDSCFAMYTTTAPPLGPPYYRNEGPTCTYAINAKLGADGLTAFTKTCIQPVNVPPLMTEFIRWWYLPKSAPDSGGGKGRAGNLDPNWLRGYVSKGVYRFDYHRQSLAYYRDVLNCDYRAGYNLATAGTDGKVIGDTRWSFLGGCPGIPPISIIPEGWSLVSIPRVQVDYTASSVFPDAYGSVFKYDPYVGDYVEAPILELGCGYWIYYTSARYNEFLGPAPGPITIPCKAGWNLIGGRETEVNVASLILSAGNIYGAAFKYAPSMGDYVETATIDPGAGIWLFVTMDCDLTIP